MGKTIMKRGLAALLSALLLLSCWGCGSSQTEQPDSDPEAAAQALTPEEEAAAELDRRIRQALETMPLEDKVAQLFILTPEDLTGVAAAVNAGETTRAAIHQYPVGGFIYMDRNLQNADQVRAMLSGTAVYSLQRVGLLPFLCVDEEGGTVSRIGGSGRFDVPRIGDMWEVGAAGTEEAARAIGGTMGGYLRDLGFNVDFAPVADVLSNPENTVVKKRAFSSDPARVSSLALALSEGLESQGVLSVFKHFPGHGATAEDTHTGFASTGKTLAELEACELIPFRDAIRAGCSMIMVAHISLPGVTGNDTPASLSPEITDGLLRQKLGYDGLVVTDALSMGAITSRYDSAQAAVMAIQAGADLLMTPKDFQAAYQGVLDAVNAGEISTARIDRSVARILAVKFPLGETFPG
ncbi:MAG: glycoside hydrolase family 3 protein [Oscillospiraceae bacterium]|nr:glycoside hydrolase family 3 protein [Oscillospiraceae bacterium]